MKTLLPLTLMLAILLGACATPISVQTDYDHSVDFSAYKTYAWATPSDGAIKDIIDNRIEAAINSELAAKGFVLLATQNDADLVIAYSTNQKTKTSVYSNGWGWGWGGVDVTQYEEGTLLIAIADLETRNMVWQSTAKKAMGSSSGSQENVNKAVAQMLGAFPPN